MLTGGDGSGGSSGGTGGGTGGAGGPSREHADGIVVRYVPLPLLVRAAWVPEQQVVLVDEALDDAGRVSALAQLMTTVLAPHHVT